jgi:hypothetical protein
MKESQFGFEYSGTDLQPIRPLYVTVLATMFVGSGLAMWSAKSPSWFVNFWTGGALGSFPGFLLGLPIQRRLRPGSFAQNRTMVWRLGAIALLFTVVALFLPLEKAPEHADKASDATRSGAPAR